MAEAIGRVKGWAGKRNEVETLKADRPCPSTPWLDTDMMGTLRLPAHLRFHSYENGCLIFLFF
jgi:hypothetical protein